MQRGGVQTAGTTLRRDFPVPRAEWPWPMARRLGELVLTRSRTVNYYWDMIAYYILIVLALGISRSTFAIQSPNAGRLPLKKLIKSLLLEFILLSTRRASLRFVHTQSRLLDLQNVAPAAIADHHHPGRHSPL